jgi:cell division protein FtsZ
MQFIQPEKNSHIIKVIGVGGGGGNAVNHMFQQGIEGVDFIIANTDKQALEASQIPNKYQIGEALTEGLGAGADPEKGRKAALESIEDIQRVLEDNTKMIFITAGMGGGTGTGAAPIIAKAAREMGILTVGIVTTPFKFEGRKRISRADDGIAKMKESVDSLLVINNEKLREMYGNLPLNRAFEHADNILATAAKSIAEIITFEGYVNVDFMDVRTVMADSGVALMGTALAEGDNRAINAAKQALLSPLLAESDIRGAKNILLNISSGKKEILMDEITEITDFIRDESGEDADLIFGCSRDEALGDSISVTVIATAFDTNKNFKEEKIQLPEFEIESSVRTLIVEEEPTITSTLQLDEDNDVDLPFEGPNDENTKASAESTHVMGLEVDRNGKTLRQTREIDLETLETVPAYVRKKISLEKISHSSATEISRLTLKAEDGKRPEIRANNRFLHDNVD